MLRNHGLLTVGTTVAEAFLAMYLMEAACTIQVRAQAGGGALVPIDPAIIASGREQMMGATHGLGSALVWPGLLRKLDRQDTSYRT